MPLAPFGLMGVTPDALMQALLATLLPGPFGMGLGVRTHKASSTHKAVKTQKPQRALGQRGAHARAAMFPFPSLLNDPFFRDPFGQMDVLHQQMMMVRGGAASGVE